MKKGIYLFSGFAYHSGFNLDYCDNSKNSNANIINDCRKIDLSQYDYFIATPPCNYWSRANQHKIKSKYSMQTKDLLKWCLSELPGFNKPLLIENVRNYKKFDNEGLLEIASKNGLFIQFVGRHTYFTNILIDLHNYQHKDFLEDSTRIYGKHASLGGDNVYNTIEIFLKEVNNEKNSFF